ncbi:hypothetical protein [Azospirillum sp. SYSU D00513]|uniref:hypothetical protein n=1 Tax=Azospirillum sp. SYSU D00513 TaxID=2812561 RepID=UPI001A978F30|nr:hypothetical protein [Azospirillum sp. SYSU D00513]
MAHTAYSHSEFGSDAGSKLLRVVADVFAGIRDGYRAYARFQELTAQSGGTINGSAALARQAMFESDRA